MDLPSANPGRGEGPDRGPARLQARGDPGSASGKTGLGVDKVLEEIVERDTGAEGRPCGTVYRP
jgi:translation elongation factor EF-4